VAEIFAALERLNRETGLTLLVAEQNSAVALRHARHATVIENGRSTLSGPAQELAARPEIRDSYLGGHAA
jgi:branched-chain amino acid transport system ATP-binding protein